MRHLKDEKYLKKLKKKRPDRKKKRLRLESTEKYYGKRLVESITE